MSTAPGSKVEGSEGAANKSYIKHSISYDTLGSTTSAAKKNNSRRYKRKPQKPISNHGFEGLLSLMQCMLRKMDNMNKTCKPLPRVKQVWVKNDETIHSLRGSGLT
jgi:hypothetical protein